MDEGRHTFGLVLGAGGTAGEAFHRGVIRAMDQLGWDARKASVIVGTSAGSIVAASLRHQSPVHHSLSTDDPRHRWRPSKAMALAAVRRPRQALSALLLTPEFARGGRETEFPIEAKRRRHGSQWPDAPLWLVVSVMLEN